MSLPYEEPAVTTPLHEHLAQAPAQRELSFEARALQAEASPAKTLRVREDAARLEGLLRTAWIGGMPWMSATQIGGRLGWSERRVREAASESLAIASGPGSPGYALAEAATPEALMHIGNAMKSQGERMFARGQRFVTAALLRTKAAEITAPVTSHQPPVTSL